MSPFRSGMSAVRLRFRSAMRKSTKPSGGLNRMLEPELALERLVATQAHRSNPANASGPWHTPSSASKDVAGAVHVPQRARELADRGFRVRCRPGPDQSEQGS